MKRTVLLALIVNAVTACSRNDDMAGMPAANAPAAAAAQSADENRSMGVVQSIDAANGSLTIAHEPIPALGWPAMTMAFKVDRPELLEGVASGERIEFTLRGRDMSAVVTGIEEAK